MSEQTFFYLFVFFTEAEEAAPRDSPLVITMGIQPSQAARRSRPLNIGE